MGKTLCIVVLALFGTSACQQAVPNSGVAPGSIAAQRDNSSGPVAFEIRDFSLDKNSESYGGVSYQGRGTLVTRDARLANGTFIVLITAKQEHENNEELTTQVLVKDGLGTVRVGTYQTDDEEKVENVRYYDWGILGFTQLHPGTIQSPGSPTSS